MQVGKQFKRWAYGRYVLFTVIEVKTQRKCIVVHDDLYKAPAISSVTISQRKDGTWLPVGTVYGYGNELFLEV